MVGLAFDAVVKGGSQESQMWETVEYYAIGGGLGLLLGILLHEMGIRGRSRVF
jgi:hypothetical protein